MRLISLSFAGEQGAGTRRKWGGKCTGKEDRKRDSKVARRGRNTGKSLIIAQYFAVEKRQRGGGQQKWCGNLDLRVREAGCAPSFAFTERSSGASLFCPCIRSSRSIRKLLLISGTYNISRWSQRREWWIISSIETVGRLVPVRKDANHSKIAWHGQKRVMILASAI